MAKVTSLGYTDTSIEGVTAVDFARGLLNYEADFRVKQNQPGKEIVLTNITSPLDRPERLRIAYSEIPNIYNGSGIDPSISAPSKRGVSVLVQLTEVISISDSVDADYRIDLPVSYHLVIKVPNSEHITGDVIEAGLGRLLSGLYDTGDTTVARLGSILRGSLTPAGL